MSLSNRLIRLGRRLRAAAAEVHYAHTRLAALSLSPEGRLPDPDAAPADYREFLLRSALPLLHEPTAAQRLRRPGRPGARL